jgi:hypothetical protein
MMEKLADNEMNVSHNKTATSSRTTASLTNNKRRQPRRCSLSKTS